MEKLNLLPDWNDRMTKFLNAIEPIFFLAKQGFAGCRILTEAEKVSIERELDKYAKTPDERGWFRENARQIWEAW